MKIANPIARVGEDLACEYLKKKGYKIIEIPIIYNSRSFKEGKKITLIDGFKALYVLLKYRFFN